MHFRIRCFVNKIRLKAFYFWNYCFGRLDSIEVWIHWNGLGPSNTPAAHHTRHHYLPATLWEASSVLHCPPDCPFIFVVHCPSFWKFELCDFWKLILTSTFVSVQNSVHAPNTCVDDSSSPPSSGSSVPVSVYWNKMFCSKCSELAFIDSTFVVCWPHKNISFAKPLKIVI